MTDLLLPVLLLITASMVFRRVDTFDAFSQGAERGLRMLCGMAARLIPLLCVIGMFRASGAISLLSGLLSPLFSAFDLSPDLLPLFILRPISGSASLAVAADLIFQAGPDSETGRIAASVLASGETTLYVIGLYGGDDALINSGKLLFSTWIGMLAALLSVIMTIRLFF